MSQQKLPKQSILPDKQSILPEISTSVQCWLCTKGTWLEAMKNNKREIDSSLHHHCHFYVCNMAKGYGLGSKLFLILHNHPSYIIWWIVDLKIKKYKLWNDSSFQRMLYLLSTLRVQQKGTLLTYLLRHKYFHWALVSGTTVSLQVILFLTSIPNI